MTLLPVSTEEMAALDALLTKINAPALTEDEETAIDPRDAERFWSLEVFDRYLTRFHPAAPVGDAGYSDRCPLKLWRAPWIRGVGLSTYSLPTGAILNLPADARQFVLLLDQRYGSYLQDQIGATAVTAAQCRQIIAQIRAEHARATTLPPSLSSAPRQFQYPMSLTLTTNTTAPWTPAWKQFFNAKPLS